MADTLGEAIEALAQAKQEHRGILRTIAQDEGMSGETRATLIEHLCDEEDERLAEIRALSGAGAPPAPAAFAPPPAQASTQVPSPARGLTVGGLRPPSASALALGGLRGSAPTSVGCLRP
ncbi:MAG: hypothetical protein AB7N76_36510 [Planctomycetota bacterium]